MRNVVIVAALAGGLAGALLTLLLTDQGAGTEADTQHPAPALEILSTPEQDALQLPFAEGVRVGNIIYLSGQMGVAPGSMQLVEGGIQAETRQTLLNIKDSLERYGSALDQVVKCTVFLHDMAEWPLMNEVYVEIFAGHRPARSALGASGLALNGRVEIECMALART
ncbi:MAG: Rid family hydrolase [Pseudomonadota bacterium]